MIRDQIKESRGSVETVGESNVNKLGVEGQVGVGEIELLVEILFWKGRSL